jgi:hypothetical protein
MNATGLRFPSTPVALTIFGAPSASFFSGKFPLGKKIFFLFFPKYVPLVIFFFFFASCFLDNGPISVGFERNLFPKGGTRLESTWQHGAAEPLEKYSKLKKAKIVWGFWSLLPGLRNLVNQEVFLDRTGWPG